MLHIVESRLLAALAPPGPALDLSGMRSRLASERVIGVLLFLCGSLSILTTIGIVAVLVYESAAFFRQVPLRAAVVGLVFLWLRPRETRRRFRPKSSCFQHHVSRKKMERSSIRPAGCNGRKRRSTR